MPLIMSTCSYGALKVTSRRNLPLLASCYLQVLRTNIGTYSWESVKTKRLYNKLCEKSNVRVATSVNLKSCLLARSKPAGTWQSPASR